MSEVSVSRPGGEREPPAPPALGRPAGARRGGGDAAAFAALYERHHQPLYRYCRSIVGDPDDAADALQSTMTRALAVDRGAQPGSAGPGVAVPHRPQRVDLARSGAGGPAEPLDADALVAPDLATDAEHRRRLADLVGDLQGLSERQRGALLMREVSGLGHAEIAAAFGAAEGAVKQSIYEARVALQDLAMGREMSCAAVRRSCRTATAGPRADAGCERTCARARTVAASARRCARDAPSSRSSRRCSRRARRPRCSRR